MPVWKSADFGGWAADPRDANPSTITRAGQALFSSSLFPLECCIRSLLHLLRWFKFCRGDHHQRVLLNGMRRARFSLQNRSGHKTDYLGHPRRGSVRSRHQQHRSYQPLWTIILLVDRSAHLVNLSTLRGHLSLLSGGRESLHPRRKILDADGEFAVEPLLPF